MWLGSYRYNTPALLDPSILTLLVKHPAMFVATVLLLIVAVIVATNECNGNAANASVTP
jgi:hypothetical protein